MIALVRRVFCSTGQPLLMAECLMRNTCEINCTSENNAVSVHVWSASDSPLHFIWAEEWVCLITAQRSHLGCCFFPFCFDEVNWIAHPHSVNNKSYEFLAFFLPAFHLRAQNLNRRSKGPPPTVLSDSGTHQFFLNNDGLIPGCHFQTAVLVRLVWLALLSLRHVIHARHRRMTVRDRDRDGKNIL